jgi:hypothetical protein
MTIAKITVVIRLEIPDNDPGYQDDELLLTECEASANLMNVIDATKGVDEAWVTDMEMED